MEPEMVMLRLDSEIERKARAVAKARGLDIHDWIVEVIMAALNKEAEEKELVALIEDWRDSAKKACDSIDKGLARYKKFRDEKGRPKNWNDFFEQEPCPDFPTIEELRAGLGEKTPRESPDLSPEEAEELFEKSDLLVRIEDYIFMCGVPKAAEKLCIAESVAKDLAKGLLDKLSVTELQEIAKKIPSSFRSPFDVPGVKSKATTHDIVDTVEESRSCKGDK